MRSGATPGRAGGWAIEVVREYIVGKSRSGDYNPSIGRRQGMFAR